MNIKNRKKVNELKITEQFLKWFNSTNKLDYKAEANNIDDSEIDIIGFSANNLSSLLFQIVTSEGVTLKLAIDNTKSFECGLGMKTIDVNLKEWVEKAINNKEKKYPKEIKEKIILLIEGGPPTSTPGYLRKNLDDFSSSDFMGIYFVSRPVNSFPESEYTKNGFIYPIKYLK